MSTVKISQLPLIEQIDANTSNTIFAGVDVSTGVTGRMTARTLAQGLYSNEILNVGLNPVTYADVVGQFSGSSPTYIQLNLQNFDANGSTDFVGSVSDSTDTAKFIDLGINGPDYNDPAYSAMKAYDGYLFTVGPDVNSFQGNLVIGAASSDANIFFAAGGTTSSNLVAKIGKQGITLLDSTHITFTDGSIQSKAASPATYTEAAFLLANTTVLSVNHLDGSMETANANIQYINGVNDSQNTSLTYLSGVDAEQNTSIDYLSGVNAEQNTSLTYLSGVNDSQNTRTTDAFDKANNALANTSGIFAGNLDVRGNLIAYSISTSNLVSFVGSTTPVNRALVELIGSSSGLQQTPSNDGYMIHVTGKDDVPTRTVLDAFGANSYPLIAGRKGRGVAGTPSAVANNDVLFRISGNGWGTTGFAPLGSGRIDFIATENYTDATRGSKIEFYNVPNGSNTINKIATFNANSVEFSGTVNPQKGFIFSPRVLVGNQTAITLDFSTDSTVKATCAADVTFTLSNYTAGKIVEVWLTNTGAQNRTITHGCTALNSTNKSTTFTLTATSSAYLRYFSIDGDNANTFVTITA